MLQTTRSPAAVPRLPRTEPRFHFTERDLSATLVTPGARLVVIEAWLDDDQNAHHQVHPVVALSSIVRQSWSAPAVLGNLSDRGTERELARRGWRLDEQSAHLEPLLIVDGHLDELSLIRRVYDGATFVLVAAPWPTEQDAERLASHVDDALRQARERAAEEQRC